MTRGELSKLARLELDLLIVTRELPEVETRLRVHDALTAVCVFPESGQLIGKPRPGLRMAGVAWGWLCLLYHYDVLEDVVTVVRIFDIRMNDAPRP